MTAITALRNLIQRDALITGNFVLKSGETSLFYFDLRRVTLTAQGAGLTGQVLWERIREAPVTAIAGPATAAIPLVTATLTAAAADGEDDLRGGFVRSAAKEHGTGQRLEGAIRPGDSIMLFEDTVTTGGSLIDAAQVLREFGCSIYGAIWLVDRGAGGLEAVREAGIPVATLFTLDDFRLPSASPWDE